MEHFKRYITFCMLLVFACLVAAACISAAYKFGVLLPLLLGAACVVAAIFISRRRRLLLVSALVCGVWLCLGAYSADSFLAVCSADAAHDYEVNHPKHLGFYDPTDWRRNIEDWRANLLNTDGHVLIEFNSFEYHGVYPRTAHLPGLSKGTKQCMRHYDVPKDEAP